MSITTFTEATFKPVIGLKGLMCPGAPDSKKKKNWRQFSLRGQGANPTILGSPKGDV